MLHSMISHVTMTPLLSMNGWHRTWSRERHVCNVFHENLHVLTHVQEPDSVFLTYIPTGNVPGNLSSHGVLLKRLAMVRRQS